LPITELSLPKRAGALALIGMAFLVALLVSAGPAAAAKGGNPGKPAVDVPAVIAPGSPAVPPGPPAIPPGQAATRPAKGGTKPGKAATKPGKAAITLATSTTSPSNYATGPGKSETAPGQVKAKRDAARAPGPQGSSPPGRVAQLPITAASAAVNPGLTSSAPTTAAPATASRPARAAPRRPARGRSRPPQAARQAAGVSGATPRLAGVAATAPQTLPQASRPAREPKPRRERGIARSLFTLPAVRDVLSPPPAVTRLVEVIPRFVWIILGVLALIAALLAAAVAIYARRLRRAAARADALAGLAATDPLTGLLNRRGIESHISTELARAVRYGGTLAVVFGDLRALKAINDRHGHEAGDRALKSVAHILRDQIREGDACGRVGGDEYAVALVNQGAEGAQAFCDRVRDCLHAAPALDGDQPLDLTLGVALFPRDGDTAQDLLAAADRDLYAQRGISVGGR
jgi:diguanylate cyclase (GGDEF)-like protein